MSVKRKRKLRACFVVVGLAGDHDEKSWWIVRAFAREAAAKAHATNAARRAQQIIEREQKRWRPYWDDDTGTVSELPRESEKNGFDPFMWDQCGGDIPVYRVVKAGFTL